MKLVQVLYRDLLQIARELDRNAAFRALISSNMLVRPTLDRNAAFRALISSNMLVRPTVGRDQHAPRLPHVDAYNSALLEFLQNRSFYLPSPTRKSAVSIVRDAFREPHATRAAVQQATDTAFVALRALNDCLVIASDHQIVTQPALAMMPTPAAQRDQSDGKTRLLRELARLQEARASASAEETPRVAADSVQLAEQASTGIFLLAHPMLDGIFSRSVVLLTEHSRRGTKGFIVNRQTTNPLVKTFKVHPRIMRAFGANKVHDGGPVRTDYAEILHGHAAFGGERVVAGNFEDDKADSIFVGMDLETAADAVEKKTLPQSDVVFLNGVSSWTTGQLESELRRGAWVPVRAPLSLAINAPRDLL
ncbi:hypothetical protein ATCC90586_006893 [Pythium insidiosum]|nr:hypothetical protein ATCC90586_006893 [Pythium insidiosum]